MFAEGLLKREKICRKKNIINKKNINEKKKERKRKILFTNTPQIYLQQTDPNFLHR